VLLPLPGRPVAIALIVTVLVVVALAIGSWVAPAAVWAPGDLAAPHAVIERCTGCHAAFEPIGRTQCLGCHTAKSFAARQIFGVGAFHQTLLARGRECLDCHTEHRGRQAPITIGREGNPHGDVVFALTATRSCTQCHAFAADINQLPVLLEVEAVRVLHARGGGRHVPGRFMRCAGCHDRS